MGVDDSTGRGEETVRLGTGLSKIRQVRFDVAAVELVAETLGVAAGTAPFRLPSGAVYQIVVPDKEGRPAVMLTLWPSIRRVDAIATAATVVFTDVSTVDLVTDVEVQFRRSNRDYLIVARGGKVIVRA
jgi:hypothetical protein